MKTIIAVVVTSAVMTGVLAYSLVFVANGVDGAAQDRETRFASHLADEIYSKLPTDQESVAIWDDAVVNTVTNFNPTWIEVNLGVWMFDYFHHDRAIVLDRENQPIYAMVDGETSDADHVRTMLQTVRPLIDQAREQIANGAVDAYAEGTADTYPRAEDTLIIDGMPTIVSVMPITSDSGDIELSNSDIPLFVSARFLNAGYAAELADNYLIAGARFGAASASDPASVPILDQAGAVVSRLAWDPTRPGAELLARIAPMAGFTGLVAITLILWLTLHLRQSRSSAEAERRNAQHLATHDPLSGLPNRSQMDATLDRELTDSDGGHPPLALHFIDLDHFKVINDSLGHAAGDELICQVGRRLMVLCADGHFVARLGGDEFGIIQRDVASAEEAESFAAAIIDAIDQPFDLLEQTCHAGCSIGFAIAPSQEKCRGELVRKADIALFSAKSSGRRRSACYTEDLNQEVQKNQTIEVELRAALERTDQIRVAFQPLTDASTLRIEGAEALLRWNHPELGFISPAAFIPVAENCGLIERLGEFVLEQAARLGRRWPGFMVAVNVSPVQMHNPHFAETVLAILSAHGMRPVDLELEITESVFMDKFEITSANLRKLRQEGVRIALDDFGTGYSSLSYLDRHPVDRIKIDRSFISEMGQSAVSFTIVQSIIRLAHDLGMKVTAEGIETEDQAELLTAAGCNTIQGFLIAPAIDVHEIEARFAQCAKAA